MGLTIASEFRYEIEPRPTKFGGGVRLYVHGPHPETGEETELGGGVFPSGPNEEEIEAAYAEAEWEAEAWLQSRRRPF